MGVRFDDPLLGGGVSKGCRGRMKEEAERQAKVEAEVGVRCDSLCVRVSS